MCALGMHFGVAMRHRAAYGIRYALSRSRAHDCFAGERWREPN